MNLTQLQPPHNAYEFFPWLKKASEEHWEQIEINQGIFGFQTQRGTKWLPGLLDEEIAEYEREMGFAFPEIYKIYLKNMNGTDLPALNVYGECGEPYRYCSDYYSYSRDLFNIRGKIEWIYEEFGVTHELVEQNRIPHIMPIVSHRFLVMDRCEKNPMLSMYGRDTIPYAPTLETFLVNSIFRDGISAESERPVDVKFWLEEE